MHTIGRLSLLLVALPLFVVACLVDEDDRSSAPGAGTAELAQQAAHKQTAPQLARSGYPNTFAYTVKSGDTLFSIAQAHGTTVETLRRLNDVPDPTQLRAGDVLYIPTPTPTPTPTATPVPTGPSVRINNGPRNQSGVALTFDMGGRVEPAVPIMNWLIANNVKATIFMTGAIVDNPNHDDGRRVLQLISQNPHLFELGNHSYSHPDFTTISDAEIRSELRRTEDSVAKYTTMPMRPLFRPPFGALNTRVLNVVGPAGYRYTIMWDVDTIDWRPVADGGPTASQMVTKVVNNSQGGTIVLMHLGGYNTLEALPAMVQGLKNRGFHMVKVSELLPP